MVRPPSPVIAVVNSSEDTVELLRIALQHEGFTSIVTGHVPDFKKGVEDLVAFVDEHAPDVFVWDISIPYEENWRFLEMVMALDRIRHARFVVTTTNKRVLDQLVGPTDSLEIVGKPYDLGLIVEAVKKAAGQAPGGPVARPSSGPL